LQSPAVLGVIRERTTHLYGVKNPNKALARDLNYLLELQAIRVRELEEPRE
jgi:hypothetical protein